jgi:hypothetical protein
VLFTWPGILSSSGKNLIALAVTDGETSVGMEGLLARRARRFDLLLTGTPNLSKETELESEVGGGGMEDRLCFRGRRPLLLLGLIAFGKIGIPNLSTGTEPDSGGGGEESPSSIDDFDGGKSKETDRVGIEDRLTCRLLPVLWVELDSSDRAGRIGMPNLSSWSEAWLDVPSSDIVGMDDRRSRRLRPVVVL